MAFSDEDRKRMRWHSRRGMLELDLILVPFAQTLLDGLDDEHQQLYRLLLDQEDQDLFGWFIRRERPPTAALGAIVDFILSAHGGRQTAH